MKFLCRAFCVLFLVAGALRAAAEDENPDTFGDYAPTADEDLIQYVPRFTMRLGFRGLTGAKSAFSGKGFISSGDLPPLDGLIDRTYQDGYVNLDSRKVIDPSGRAVPIANDGRTNEWSFTSDTQVTPDGLMAMHQYTAQVTDEAFRTKNPGNAFGVELTLDRDYGKVFGSRLHWGIIGGMSINQFASTLDTSLAANVTTVTDYYSLGGQTAPAAPYTGPIFAGVADVTVLLGNQILGRTTGTTATPAAVLTHWHLRGAYMTFRAGPTLMVPLGGHFSATLSAGPVLAYAGSTYDIVQTFTPATGNAIVSNSGDGASTVRPGFYVDANLQWAMTDNSGLYLGGVYQDSGNYTQTVVSPDGKSTYEARVDLSKLQGIRAGVSFKF